MVQWFLQAYKFCHRFIFPDNVDTVSAPFLVNSSRWREISWCPPTKGNTINTQSATAKALFKLLWVCYFTQLLLSNEGNNKKKASDISYHAPPSLHHLPHPTTCIISARNVTVASTRRSSRHHTVLRISAFGVPQSGRNTSTTSATHILCDCEAIAYLRFHHLRQFFVEPSDYYYIPINKVLHFIRGLGLIKG
jgi:hypothetical protein